MSKRMAQSRARAVAQISGRRRNPRARASLAGKSRALGFCAPFMLALLMGGVSFAGTLVTPDGRTQTQLSISGGTTDVTTSTIRNGNGFNSFSQFQVGQGDTVNLHVPDQAQRLLNVIHNGPVNIDGTVNGYQSGKIGGNIYFADPYGFVVGPTGAVNVGSLTVRTPTTAATEKLIDAQGNIDDPSVSSLLDGTIPISPDGSVVIRGRINAQSGVSLSGQTVTTAPDPNAVFDASVNTNGLQQGGRIVVSNGTIEILAAGDATIGGTLSANGGANRAAGTINVTSGGNTRLTSGSTISARGRGSFSNGGHVRVMAGQDLNVDSGAKVNVSGGTSGDGGTIELSATGTARIAGAKLDAGATYGQAGSVLIDPTNVVIGPTSDVDVGNGQASIDSDGGNVTITASNSITVESGGYINTRQTGSGNPNDTSSVSTGNSGYVDLTAPTLTIAGDINAFAINAGNSGFLDGNITLTATASDSETIGLSSADTAIDISGTLHGGVIDLEANSTAVSKPNYLDDVLDVAIPTILGLSGGYVAGHATSAITIDSSAHIQGSGDVTLNAQSTATADLDMTTLPLFGTALPLVPSVLVGNVTAHSSATVASGAYVHSGGALTVKAHNIDDLDIDTLTVTFNTPIDASVAYSTADIESNADVAEGADISAQSAHISAINNNSFNTSVTAASLGTGSVGLTFAIFEPVLDQHSTGETTPSSSDKVSEADAHFGPSLTLTGPASGQDLTVEADSLTSKDAVSASSTVGTNALLRLVTVPIAGALSGTSALSGGLADAFKSLTVVKLGAAIAVTLGDQQNAKAILGGDATQAPTITANQVAVVANTLDAGVRSNANSATNSPDEPDPNNPAAFFSVSAGVAIANRELGADAEIGSGAQVTAPYIGVSSGVSLPVTIDWLDFSDFSDFMSHINGTGGAVNDVLTSFTNSTADAGAAGFAGSLNLFNVDANSTAFVGQGATLSSTGAAAGPWQVALDSGDVAKFDQSVAVSAARDIETLDFGGSISIFFNGAGSLTKDAAVFGVTYESVNYSGNTDAGIGAEATVSSDQGISVDAEATDRDIAISPAAGRGDGSALSGMVALFDLDTGTHASISSSADVSAALVNVTANQSEHIRSVAGAIMAADSNSIGGLETTNTIDTDVKAYVGDNSADDPTGSLIPNFTAPTAGITATDGTLTMAATESGLVESLAVSIDAGSNAAIGGAVAVDNINDSVGAVIGDSAVVNAMDVYVKSNADDTIHTIAMGAAGSGGSGVVAAGGSAATSLISPTVLASVNGGASVTADNNAGILATNNDEIDSIAGAAGFCDCAAGVGIAIVVNQIGGSTTASITGDHTSVDANGDDTGDTFLVNSGTLAAMPDTASINKPASTPPDLTEDEQSVSGLALVATSHQGVESNGATLGVGNGLAVSLLPITTIIASSSTAYVQDASVDTKLTGNPLDADPKPDLDVIASNQTYTGDFVAAVAVSNNLAGAGAASTIKYNDSSKAYIDDATVGKNGANDAIILGPVEVQADSTQAGAAIVMGGAGSAGSGGAASLSVMLFGADTEAYVTGGSLESTALNVAANSDNGGNALVGAGALAGGIAVGGSVAVTINNDTTLGYVGDRVDEEDAGTIDDTTLKIGSLSTAATTDNDLHSLIIAGAGGYTAGIAAMVDVTTLSSTTKSGIYATTVDAAPFPAASSVNVAANENDTVDSNADGGAAGGAGVGIAVNVVVLHSSVTGTILDSDVRASGAVDVSAEGDKDITSRAVTGAVGYYAGVGAAVGVVLAGTDVSSDVEGQINAGGTGSLNNVDQMAPGYGVAASVNSGSPDAITASVAGGSLSASSLSIAASATTSTSNHAIGAAAGGGAGVGGAVAYTDVGDTVIASLDSTDPLVSGLSISAQMGDGSGAAVSTQADAGGGGAVGIGAGVAIGKLDDTVAAQLIGDATGDTKGNLSIMAGDAGSISSTAAGGAAGGVAVGVMVATASKNSNVNADVQLGDLDKYQSITLSASGSGSVSSSATGVSGGVVDAGNAAAATSSDDENINARFGDGTIVTNASTLTSIGATDTPDLSANAYGVAVSGGAALGLSVALANLDPTVTATVGDNVSVSGDGGFTLSATLVPDPNQTAASTSAFAGAGGYMLALDGAVAITSNNSDVEAYTGDSLVLPDGDVGILASNTSNQDAYASGVGVGGIAGGASDAQANTDSTTKATLGTDATAPSHTGALSVQALGNDTDTSHAVAGTYGLVAGNASFATTSDTADVEATIDGRTSLPASTVTLSAAHQDNYAEFADSTEVSVLGASGAGADHSANSNVTATIGNDVSLIAGNSIDINAENDFTRIGTDDAADAGGGGVVNGAGATSNTEIGGNAKVVIADDAVLAAGSDPVSNPGHINILADSKVEASDIVSISTGGALEGSGDSNTFNANVNNDVSLGNDDTFVSFGNFNAGTYTITAVTVESLGSTWGVLGAVANANTYLTLASNQSVELGAGSIVDVYGNANLTAGQNPADIQDSEMEGDAAAETYVKGFVAVPDAHAYDDVTNNTSLLLASGSVVNAGENVTLGSYTGQITAGADGTGHGYELGLIPVTDGGQSATPHETSTAEIDGTVTAGAYNDVVVNIPDCADQSVYCDQVSASGQLSAANILSPIGAYLQNFLPVAYINQHSSGADAQFLSDGVSSSAVDAIALNTLFASPGNVTVHADTVTGDGSLTANGSASITVTNDSPDYLTLANLQIPNIPGGNVYFTGLAQAVNAPGITVTQNNPGAASTITVTDTFDGPVGNSALGPAIFVGGGIQNLGGSVGITDPSGSLGQFAPIVAQDVVIDVPAGSLLVDLAPNELYTSGPSVEADWAPYMIIPGNIAGTAAPSADAAIAYAVNAMYNNGQTSVDSFNSLLDNRGADAYGAQGASYIVYGACLPTNTGVNCGIGGAGGNQAASPINAVWDLGHFDGFHSGSRGIAAVPIEQLFTASYVNITPATETAQASALTANKISINATYIDIDSDITAGPPTSWSVSLPGSLAQTIANDQAAYQDGSVSNPNFALPGASVIGAADSLINVTYVAGATAADGRIVVDNVLASAQVAASIKLDGGIISTNALGHIHVNAGLGQVNIDNETGTALTVNNVSAGNAERLGGLSGTVEIVDTLKTTGIDHIWYVYTPGAGTSYYTSTDPNATLAEATLSSSGAGTSFSYDPVAGLRWQWSQTAFLSRSVTLDSSSPSSSAWGFNDPNGNPLGLGATNVWYYTDTVDPGQAYTTDPGHAGTLVGGYSDNLPYMYETITGTVGFGAAQSVNYSCIQKESVSCGFQEQGTIPGYGTNFGNWDFDYITQGTVTLMTSVKADNPVAIDFSGSSRGSVNITSNAPVTFNGQITNPDGDTSLTSTGGGLVTSANGSILSNNLTLSASGAVGTASNLFNTTQTHDGTLTATAAGGVYLASTNGLNIASVNAGSGNVVLSAQGDIKSVGTPSPATIIGNNVDLIASHGGSIGASAPLTLAATGTVNTKADGIIALEQTQGDLFAGTIASTGPGGDNNVHITVDNGALKDANNITAAQTLSDAQQQQVWQSLKLTAAFGGGVNSTAASPTVTAVSNTIGTDYQQYWLLIDHGTVADGAFTLNSDAIALFQPIAAAAGLSAQDYAAQLYAKVVGDFNQYVGTDWASQAEFQSQVSNFSFTPSQSEIDVLTNNGDATWTEGQLKSALSLTALQPSTNTTLGTTTPNVAGSELDLTASNGIGSLADPVHITIDELKSGNLTPDQETAIALAKNPGDIVFSGTDANGNVVHFSGATTPAGVTITGVDIKQTAPLFVTADTLNATAPEGGIFIQAASGNLNLGLVDAGSGTVSLAAPHSILAAAPGSQAVILGGDISLLAGSGDIGSADTPLVYTGSSIASASAGGNIYLTALGGDMDVGRIFAGGNVVLDAPDGGIAPLLSGVTLDAANVVLHAEAGDIGTPVQPFEVQLAAGGTLSGDASGAAYLEGAGDLDISGFHASEIDVTATANLTGENLNSSGNIRAAAGGNAAFTDVEAAGDATLSAVGSLSTNNVSSGGALNVAATDVSAGDMTSGGTMTVTAINNAAVTDGSTLKSGAGFVADVGGSLKMGASSLISAVKQASLTVTSDAVLGQIKSLFDGDHAITVTAGRILSNGDGRTNIVATALDARTYLAAHSGIGAPSLFLTVNTPWLDPTTIAGDIYIHALADITIPNLSVPAGISITADGNLLLNNLNAGGNAVLLAANNLSFGDITGQADVTASAGNAINGDTLSAADTASLTGGPASIQVDQLSAPHLILVSAGDLNLADLEAADSISLSAPNVTAHIVQTGGTAPLAMDIQGNSGGAAASANLTINAPNGVNFGTYSVVDGAITTNALAVNIQNGHVPFQLFLITPATDLYMNDRSPRPVRNVTEQFFTPGKDFFLYQDGTHTVTNSYLIDFGPGITVTTIDSHGRASTGLSLVRTAPLPLSATSWTKIFAQESASGPDGLILPDPWNGAAPNLGVFENWVVEARAGAAVNTGAATN